MEDINVDGDTEVEGAQYGSGNAALKSVQDGNGNEPVASGASTDMDLESGVNTSRAENTNGPDILTPSVSTHMSASPAGSTIHPNQLVAQTTNLLSTFFDPSSGDRNLAGEAAHHHH